MSRRAFLGGLVALALTAGAPLTLAGTPAAPGLEITVIHASKGDGGTAIDPALRYLPQLTQEQPFVRYNVFKLLDRGRLVLEPGKPATKVLPTGRTLQVTLSEVTEEKGQPRYRVRAEISEPGKQAFLKLLEVTANADQPFFVGGQSYEGGALFIELVIRR
jgi:hypothetical protein